MPKHEITYRTLALSSKGATGNVFFYRLGKAWPALLCVWLACPDALTLTLTNHHSCLNLTSSCLNPTNQKQSRAGHAHLMFGTRAKGMACVQFKKRKYNGLIMQIAYQYNSMKYSSYLPWRGILFIVFKWGILHSCNLNVENEIWCWFFPQSLPPSGSKLWVLYRDPWRAAVQQREAAQQWRPMGGWDSSQHTGGLSVQIDSLLSAKMCHMKMIYLIILLCKEIICSFTDIPVSYIWAVKPCSLRFCCQKNAQITCLVLMDDIALLGCRLNSLYPLYSKHNL